MNSKILIIFFMALFPFFPTNSYCFGNYHADDPEYYDDEEQETGFFGFIRRHKVLSTIFATSTCAGIIVYNNQDLKNSFLSGFDLFKSYFIGKQQDIVVLNSEKFPDKINQSNEKQTSVVQKNDQNDQEVVNYSHNEKDDKNEKQNLFNDTKENDKKVKFKDPIAEYLVVQNTYKNVDQKLQDAMDAANKLDVDIKIGMAGRSILGYIKECVFFLRSCKNVFIENHEKISQSNNLNLVMRDIDLFIVNYENLEDLNNSARILWDQKVDSEKLGYYLDVFQPILKSIIKNASSAKSDLSPVCNSKIDFGRTWYKLVPMPKSKIDLVSGIVLGGIMIGILEYFRAR